ncbi:hypothetical protein GCM10009544_26560 [Streptomyces stramineus]|uniref:Tn3 transposase DDE domain-containing protein n=1 Tax=Streptomyces stramineus TaxID=173861 RepID=A0ABP3JV37_9ACTN
MLSAVVEKVRKQGREMRQSIVSHMINSSYMHVFVKEFRAAAGEAWPVRCRAFRSFPPEGAVRPVARSARGGGAGATSAAPGRRRGASRRHLRVLGHPGPPRTVERCPKVWVSHSREPSGE